MTCAIEASRRKERYKGAKNPAFSLLVEDLVQ